MNMSNAIERLRDTQLVPMVSRKLSALNEVPSANAFTLEVIDDPWLMLLN
jgi:hypothetical protein